MLLSPLFQAVDALQYQIIPIYDLLNDFVLQFLGIIVDVHQVQLEPLVGVKQHQSFDFGILDEVHHGLITLAHVFDLVVDVLQRGRGDQVDVRVITVSAIRG
jgi:hypothetical protein